MRFENANKYLSITVMLNSSNLNVLFRWLCGFQLHVYAANFGMSFPHSTGVPQHCFQIVFALLRKVKSKEHYKKKETCKVWSRSKFEIAEKKSTGKKHANNQRITLKKKIRNICSGVPCSLTIEMK